MKKRRYQADYQKRHVTDGLCAKCPQPATHGQLCEACRMKSREAQRRWREKQPNGYWKEYR